MATEVYEAVLVETIRQAGAVLVAVVGLLGIVGVPVWRRLGRIKNAAEATQHQTQNDHGTNLRDDLDEVRGIATEGRDIAVSNQAAILALAAEVRLLGEHPRRRPLWRKITR